MASLNQGERFRASRTRSRFETGLVSVGFALLFLYLPHWLVGDDYTRFRDIDRLLHHGRLSDSRYSLVMPLASTPFMLLGDVVRSPAWWVSRFNVVFVALGSLFMVRLLRDYVDRGLLRRLLLILLFASFLTNRLRDYNAEVFTGTLVAIGLTLIATRRYTRAGWSAIVVGVVNTPAALGGAALVAVADALRTRRLRVLLAPVIALALIMAEAWIRRGGPFVSGYEGDHGLRTLLPYSGRPGFSYPFLLGVLSIFFAFGRGLVFFVPGLLLGLSSTTKRWLNHSGLAFLVALMLLFVAGLVLVYARWWAWYGGTSWGPRFFVFAALPASVFIALGIYHAGERPLVDAATLLVLVLSSWVGVSGAIADLSYLDFCLGKNGSHEGFCNYVPEFSSLWHPFLHFPALTWSKALVAGYCAVVFAYLAAPLVVALARALRASVPTRAWAAGWRL